MTDFRSFSFFNICIKCHKFSFKHYFHCIPEILISCIFIFISLKIIILISLETFPLTYVLFRSVLFTLYVFEDFAATIC